MKASQDIADLDRPSGVERTDAQWGSDAIAQILRELGIDYIALNPGASYRGLHDSLVNFLGNERPQMLVCLHEEHAVAMAHGYAKVAGRPMAALVHSNVGLMHASMAIFNAWCDRTPILVLGATGPLDATQRRPWIEWIHTAVDQGALVRDYTKWDDQPGSIGAALESIARAWQIARTEPCGPTYVCLDQTVQNVPIETSVKLPRLARHGTPLPARPATEDVRLAAQWLLHATSPVILMGRVSSHLDEWNARVSLAETLGAKVITDLKTAASFPTTHPLHSDAPGYILSARNNDVLAAADVILDLNFIDPGGTVSKACGMRGSPARYIYASLDHQLARGWSADYCQLPEVDLHFAVPPDSLVKALSKELRRTPGKPHPRQWSLPALPESGPIRLAHLAAVVNSAFNGAEICFVRLPLRWPGTYCKFEHPMDYIGYDGGGGIGSGPGMAIGAALALRDSNRLPVAILGDGDLLMGANAIWTAARYRIPILVIVANNRGYHNDVNHQETVALQRNRPVENKFIGQAIIDPDPDIPGLARTFGWSTTDEITDLSSLARALSDGLEAVRNGQCHLVSVQVNVS